MMETFVEFTFEAAHKTTPDTPLHGHTFIARIYFHGPREPQCGWSQDLSGVQEIVSSARAHLDHAYLNDVEGLAYPSLENVTAWIWNWFNPRLDGLSQVELRRGAEGHAEGCTYRGPVAHKEV